MICNTPKHTTSSARPDHARLAHRRHNKHAVVTPYKNGHHIIPSQLTRMHDSGHAQLPRPSRPSIRASRDSPSANQPSRITSPRITAIRHHQPHIRPPSAFHVLQAGLPRPPSPSLRYHRPLLSQAYTTAWLRANTVAAPSQGSSPRPSSFAPPPPVLSKSLEASPRLHAALPG